MSIFVASGGYHAELKLPYGDVRGVAAGEFTFRAAPSVSMLGVTGEEYGARRYGTIEPDGREAVASGTLVTEKDPCGSASGALDY